MWAYARGPAFCWVHCQHAQNGGALHDLPASQSDGTQLKADLDLDLEHTLDAGLPGVWGPSCASLVAIRSFACEKKRFIALTDRLTRDRHELPRAKLTVQLGIRNET